MLKKSEKYEILSPFW